jgi:UDP-N-acetylmuramyl-tripeptide synthetase
MTFAELTSGIQGERHGAGDPEIQSLTYDSREVGAGGLFVALVGQAADAHRYIGSALESGAAALVLDVRGDLPDEALVSLPTVPTLVVPDSRRALAELADRFYGRPFDELNTIAVTGTNGKTTTTLILESIFTAARRSCGVIGTIFFRLSGWEIHGRNTTPESSDLASLLREYINRGADSVAVEASSHGLQMHRLDGARFDVAVFTNLSHDHLDFHGDMERYFRAKEALFTEVLPRSRRAGKSGVAIINVDDPYGRRLVEAVGAPLVTYGLDGPADVTATELKLSADDSRMVLHLAAGEAIEVSMPLVGRHNVYNAVAAAAAAEASGIAPADIAKGLLKLPVIPGRLEPVRREDGQGPRIFVDYAHTPDALQSVLQTLADLEPSALWVIFGCGGDRDRSKRPEMGQVAAALADVVVVTSDNPRSEPPESIIEAIVEGIDLTTKPLLDRLAPDARGYVAQVDRAKAIQDAVLAAWQDTIVLVAGKGHETTQEIAGEKSAFDDRIMAARALAKWTPS